MKFVALISGGKDSCYNILHCLRQGHELVALANLYPEEESVQELDSFMFQTVGHDIVSLYSECTGVPLFRQPIRPNSSEVTGLNYTATSKHDEIEQMFQLLSRVQKELPEVQGVSVGAILSSYQRTRVENVCSRLGLTALSYLWQRNQYELMSEMCSMSKQEGENSCLLDARLIKVAAIGLDDRHLGKSLPQVFPTLQKLYNQYGVHICGEGGEFETMVLDAPFFRKGFLQTCGMEVDPNNAGGVYNLRLKVQFRQREVSDAQLQEILNRLPVPPLFDDKWLAIIKPVDKNVDTISKRTTNNDACTWNLTINEVADRLYISNICPRSTGNEDIEHQACDVFEQLQEVLDQKKMFPCQALFSNLLLRSMSDFAKVNAIYSNFFDVSRWGPLPPARACVATNQLAEGTCLLLSVELATSCTVSKVDDDLMLTKDKNGLHVQGISYWAPCNIGPYSQAIWLNNDSKAISNISGQIALIPKNMEMVDSNSSLQAVLSLRHFDTIKTTISTEGQLFTTCFIANEQLLSTVQHVWSRYSDERVLGKQEDSLVIIKVSELPHRALCEWSGISYSLKDGEDDNSSESESRSKEIPPPQLLSTSEWHFVMDGKYYIVAFSNDHRNLIATIEQVTKQWQVQINIYYSSKVSQKNLKELAIFSCLAWNPVEEVYSSKGESFLFGIQMILHPKELKFV